MSVRATYVQIAAIGFAHVAFDHERLIAITLVNTAAGPQARASEWPSHVRDVVARLERYARGDEPAFHEVPLPLDELTPFAARVSRQLRGTAPGSVLAYGDLAAQCGAPGASRAIGGTLARNRWLLVVPCHRVVRTGGALGGFSGGRGVATKRALLEHEQSAFRTVHAPG